MEFPSIVKRLLKFTIPFFFFVLAAIANGATYYVDFSGGDDAGSGTSKTSPWKRCPGMAGFSGNYSHQPGDRFIFKGGVTWPRSCFQMKVTAGGSSDSNRDYYGVDQSWFSGSTWNRPKFDFQHNQIGSFQSGAGVFVTGTSFITFDNLELANHRQPLDTTSSPVAQGSSVITLWGAVNSVTVQNCYIHDWDVALPVTAPNLDGGSSGAVYYYNTGGGGGSNLKALNNLVTQEGVSCRSGRAFNGMAEVAGNEVRYVHTILIGGGSVHDNHFHHLEAGSDPAAHTNTLYMVTPGTVYNNVIHDIWAGNQIIYCEPGFSATAGNLLVYNNVIFDGTTGGSYNGCIVVDPEGAHAETTGVLIFNNTLQHAGQTIRIAARPGKRTGLVELANNHHIGNGVNRDANSTITYTDHGTDIVQSMSAASGFGAVPSNGFRPTSSSAPTMNSGMALLNYFSTDIKGVARGFGGKWDAGAYEYNGTGGGSLPTPAPTASPTTTPGPTSTPGPSATPGSTPVPTPPPTSTPGPIAGLSFDATDGVISAPFVASGDGVSQPFQTVDPTLGGQATYTVTIPEAGDYGVAADVICPSEGSNSFFINFDDQPAAPSMIWDASTTNGAERRIVSWRGNGSDTANQFAPKIFTLSQGIHQLIVRGREGAAQINRFTIVKAPSPPSNLVLKP